MKSTLFPNVEKLSKGFDIAPLDPADPRIQEACEHYKRTWNLPATASPAAWTWMGVFDRDELLLVCGEKHLDQDTVEVTDLYPMPHAGRRAVAAVYLMLSVLRGALARGVHKQMIATCLYANKSFQKALDRMFGVPPMAVMYSVEHRPVG